MKILFLLATGFISATGFSQITKIYAIQGNGAASPLISQTVTTEGVVYADFQGTGLLSGFFIQDTIGDANPLTSDGVFVFNPGGTDVAVGDYVTVTGQVQEFFELTEIGNVTNVSIVGTITNMPAPVAISLPVSALTDLEPFEGMYVTFPQNLTVTDQYNLGKYGEFTLATARQFIATNGIDPNDDPASGTTTSGNSNVPAIQASIGLNARSRILIDDAKTSSYPNPVPYVDPVMHTLRNGSTVQDIHGALSYGFSKYRLMPVAAPAFVYAARPVFEQAEGDIQVASFNMLNFFSTLDNGSNDARGADSPAEYVRQRNKLVAALDTIRADIFALIEVENNGTATADSLVNALNTAIGSPTYALVTESNFTGTYAIKNVFIYNTNTVTPLDSMMTSTDVLFYPPPIAHQFQVNATGGRFNLIANHYRYKGCDDAAGLDLDQLDGQSCYNETRRQQSIGLIEFFDHVAELTHNDAHLIVGDFNAYEQEDPIDIFVDAGYNKLINNDYSYAYMNEFGSLDHVFASSELTSSVEDAFIWHINSDEPPVTDYNLESVVNDLYMVNPYRSSDHDPVIIGLSPENPTAGINENKASDLRIFPNPFKNELIIEVGLETDVHITDISGREVKAIHAVQGTYTVDTADLSAGVLLVTFYRNGQQVETRRVVKN